MSKNFIFIGFLCSILASTSQVMLKISVKNLKLSFSFHYYLNNKYFFLFLLSLLLYFVALVLWIIVLKNLELSKAVAFMILSFILVFLFSIIILKEPLTIKKLIGISLSIMGIVTLIF